ncbi:hypothetical protein SYNTR_0676 [Candidatus Syntrophocurvum alkaliphilum]|uniref:Chromosome segregation ATPase n=1 Tax=Candidatus Syntrophocurvum alkaliphilum TaxID=2293317 RepID=A0A6I6DIA1_9FIRM|nr:hypothetical protein [Candidatus Syntrophocurvum alkaliphilum]QGT99269.1 hypothetical protein SYNTR_0676 [Candidatus Syntrophocurvum alkaliphilum]
MEPLKNALAEFQNDYLVRKGEFDKLNQIIDQKQIELRELDNKIQIFKQVSTIYQLASEYARKKSKNTMESLVSNALTIVFPNDLKFNIELEEKGERTEAYFLVSSTYGGEQIVSNEPQESRGGGIVDIVALALRVSLLETSRPKLEGPLLLDEPAKHVSGEYSKNVAEFLNMVVQNFNRQIIMVTHNQHLSDAGDIAYEVFIENGQSNVISKFNQDNY